MTDTPFDAAEARSRLQEIESEIAQLRGDEQGLNVGDLTGVEDSEDVAARNTNLEETQALVESLEQRRDRLREQLGDA
jgi:hypothetical protein